MSEGLLTSVTAIFVFFVGALTLLWHYSKMKSERDDTIITLHVIWMIIGTLLMVVATLMYEEAII